MTYDPPPRRPIFTPYPQQHQDPGYGQPWPPQPQDQGIQTERVVAGTQAPGIAAVGQTTEGTLRRRGGNTSLRRNRHCHSGPGQGKQQACPFHDGWHVGRLVDAGQESQ
jgi:hypothetical protein